MENIPEGGPLKFLRILVRVFLHLYFVKLEQLLYLILTEANTLLLAVSCSQLLDVLFPRWHG